MRFIELHLTGGRRLLLNAGSVVSVEEWREEGRAANAAVNTVIGERYHVLETYDEVFEAGVGKDNVLDGFNPDRVITLVDDPLIDDKTDVCIVSKYGALRLSARSAETLWAQLGHIVVDGEKT
jgi:hypothetical protein